MEEMKLCDELKLLEEKIRWLKMLWIDRKKYFRNKYSLDYIINNNEKLNDILFIFL